MKCIFCEHEISLKAPLTRLKLRGVPICSGCAKGLHLPSSIKAARRRSEADLIFVRDAIKVGDLLS